MIHLALWLLSFLFVAAVCVVVAWAAFWLINALVVVIMGLLGKAVDIVAALLFCLIAAPMWAWYKGRRYVRLLRN